MKKIICIIFLSAFFIPHTSFSQMWRTYNSMRLAYMEKQKYGVAIEYAEKALQSVKEELGEKDTLYPYMLSGLAETYYRNGNSSKALDYYQQAREIWKTIPGENRVGYATSVSNIASMYQLLGNAASNRQDMDDNYNKAVPLYLEAIKIRKEVIGPKHPDYATSLNNLAVLYQAMRNYTAAEKTFLESMKIRKESLGENDPDYGSSCGNLGLLYNEMGNYAAAEPLFIKAVNIRKEALGTKHPDYASAVSNLAGLYTVTGNFFAAEALSIEALNIKKEILGERHPGYITSMNDLASLYYSMGRYHDAEILLLKVVKISKEVLGARHPDYASHICNLAVLYCTIDKYTEAETLYAEAMNIRKEVFGIRSTSYAESLNNLGGLYKITGKFDTAELMYSEAADIFKEIFGAKHPSYAQALNNLAGLYKTMGNYNEAEPLYIEAKNIRKEVFGEKHADYAKSLDALALLYEEAGDYSRAEPMFIEAKNIRKEILGEKHPDYATSLNNLAQLYVSMGNYAAAESLYVESAKIIKEALGPKHTDYALVLNNLAGLYKDQVSSSSSQAEIESKYRSAEKLYLEAKDIIRELYGTDHPDYAASLNNLGVLYKDLDYYSKAQPLFVEAMSILKYLLGAKHPDYAATVLNLASTYKDMGNYIAAEPLYMEALTIFKEVRGTRHPDYATALTSVALLYYLKGDYQAAETYLVESIEVLNGLVKRIFAFLSEKEKELFFKTLSDNYDHFYGFALKRKSVNKEITTTVFNNVVKNKGLLLKSSTAMRTAILNSKDTSLINSYNRWIALKKEISEIYANDISKRVKNPEELEQKANDLEKNLVRNSQEFGDFEKLQNITWESVKQNLLPGEAAIEFIRFRVNYDTVQYCALVVKPDSKYPEMIALFEESKIAEIYNSTPGNNLIRAYYLYGSNAKPTHAIYDLVWQPLEKYLTGVKTVYYSPDGLLHKICFAAMANDKNVLLCDEYTLQQMCSTGKLAMKGSSVLTENFNVALLGGIQFSSDSTITKVWPDLPGTKTESEKVVQLLKEKNIKTDYFTGEEATEEAFKNLFGPLQSESNEGAKGSTSTSSVAKGEGEIGGAGDGRKKITNNEQGISNNEVKTTNNKRQTTNIKPEIVHIDTHGFFFPDPEEKMNKMKDSIKRKEVEEMLSLRTGEGVYGFWNFYVNKNPLMRSGVVLAHANDVWNKRFDKKGEDGVLTAQEVTQLDMRKTKLVVLSACETGLGDIRGSEGVYGLQRAFKMAGVNYIMMSLWPVSDKETAEFMIRFYEILLLEKDIRKAFAKTQLEMRKKSDPYYWAAFVLLE